MNTSAARTVHELKDGFRYAMHGNGAYKGFRRTNCRDAFVYWYQKGARIFEIDMARAEDGPFVCMAHHVNAHDMRRLEIFEVPEAYTAEWFLKQKLYPLTTKGMLPLSLADLVELLRQFKDILLMLDLFGVFCKEEAVSFARELSSLIADDDSLWDRILVETYNLEMMAGITEHAPKAHMIYGIEYADASCELLSIEELKKADIQFVSYLWHYRKRHTIEIKEYAAAGMTVFSKTADNLKTPKLKKAGVHVNIIDQYYSGRKAWYQWPLYMMSYFKLAAQKIYFAIRYR